jgi:hypothetical protein
MNRITQRHFPEESVKDLETLHDCLMRALGHRVPPTVTALYARPQVLAEGLVLWHSSFAGQPIALKDLSEQASADLQEKLFERLKAIKGLADQESSRSEHDPHVLQLLHHASADPPLEAIYSVGGQPVLLFWDKAIASAVPREKLIAPIPPVLATIAPSGRRVWPWWLLVLLLLLALIWWLWCPRSPLNAVDPLSTLISSQPVVNNTPETAIVSEPQSQASIPPPPVSPPEPEPEPEPEPKPEPKPADPPYVDPEPVVEPEPEPVPVPEPPKVAPAPVPVAPPPKPKPVAKPPATIDTAKNLCPADRPPALAPEMVVVFDASGSMMININATRQEEIWAFSVLNRGPLAMQWLSPQERRKFEQLISQPTRMVTAQQATINVLERLPSDVNTGLVVVDACPVSRNLGRYAPSQRGQMIQQLRGLSPRQGTPLADGILEAGRLVDGVNRESTILLVSDGGESCGGDPCMVARELARQKPHLKINVVDIGGSGAASCVAQATGGKVYTVSNVSELKIGLDRAAQDALGPSNCKK